MTKLKFLIAIVGFLFCAVLANAQKAKKPSPKQAPKPKVETHRGTLVLNMHPVVDRKAQVEYASLPKWGTVYPNLPEGAEMVTNGTDSLYYKSGIFYTKKSKAGYAITQAAPGIRLNGLPFGYKITPTKTKTYFYYYGTFYSQSGNSDFYETVTSPEEAIVHAIPDGYEIRKIQNEEYYFLGGTYYGQVDAPALKNKIGYEVVTIIEAY